MYLSWGGFGFGFWKNEMLWTVALGFCCLYIYRDDSNESKTK